jgi:hypothetical protein
MLVANIHMRDSMPPDLNEEFTCEPSFVKILRTGHEETEIFEIGLLSSHTVLAQFFSVISITTDRI